MLLTAHIIIALSSIVSATLGFVSPSQRRLQVNQVLIAGTIASGTLLVFSAGEHLLRLCLSGLVYTIAVSILSVAAKRKLTKAAL